MTNDEWRACCMLLENCWKGDLDETKRAAYHTMLGTYEAELMMAALHQLAQNPSPWVPTVPEIIQAMRNLTEDPVPPWSEAWQIIERSMAYRPDDKALEWLEENHHPVILEFVKAEGLSQLRRLPVYDGDHGGATMTMLQKRWVDFTERTEERTRRGQALGSAQRAGIGLSKIKGLEGAPVAELGAGE